MGFQRAWLRKEKLKTLKGMVFVTMILEKFKSSRGKMEDFNDRKIEEMVVIAEEWLGWPLECLQQLNGGRKVVWWLLKGVDGCWDACSSRVRECWLKKNWCSLLEP
ncbi:hypothetical protein L3X38_016841 [Prunus dulcis]|uniref:Uncharacterized protein n=1 Tax=Prunus dulcis TaxID=3755 RepID=A0AAD4Z982_PRUDU|nr:hypothetical protein L3X38_016841 [Prunus dulcis]